MSDKDRQPDHGADPRGGGQGDQLPEDVAPGQTETDRQGRRKGGPPAGAGDAPDTAGEGDAGAAGEGRQSTGNPHAAG